MSASGGSKPEKKPRIEAKIGVVVFRFPKLNEIKATIIANTGISN
jgi:hypothetical protein